MDRTNVAVTRARIIEADDTSSWDDSLAGHRGVIM
jgi:hypothetical protein